MGRLELPARSARVTAEMSVWRRFPNHGLPSLVTSNVADRKPIFRSSSVARLMLQTLLDAADDESIDLLAWIIMPDHFHAVVAVPPAKSLGRFVQLVKGRFAREYNLTTASQGSVWQGRYHERALRSDRELYTAVEYVHRNPVAAGIGPCETDYEWTSARRNGAHPASPVRLKPDPR
jgi:REP element-mobilizing transposase RayT